MPQNVIRNFKTGLKQRGEITLFVLIHISNLPFSHVDAVQTAVYYILIGISVM